MTAAGDRAGAGGFSPLWRPMEFDPAFRVVDEADDWIVVDKPAPLQVHPAKPDSPPTLLDGLQALLAYELANGARLSIINRLDRDTSGLVLVAKNAAAARQFGRAMMRRTVEKAYLALVWGWPAEDAFSVEAPLRRRGEVEASPIHLMQCVHPEGAPSRTEFHVRHRFERDTPAGRRFALVEAHPVTGRMHQIRVHLAHAGHPVVGDKIYGPSPQNYLEFIDTGWTPALAARLLLPRHALHSCRLALSVTPDDDPDGKFPPPPRLTGRFSWEAPLAADLQRFLGRGALEAATSR